MAELFGVYMRVLRDKKSSIDQFRHASVQITHLLAYETIKHIPIQKISVETPLSVGVAAEFADPTMCVPILRSGITMMPVFLGYLPMATVAVLGIRRDEKTAKPTMYYENVPPISKQQYTLILDPMIATGGTGVAAITLLKQRGVDPNRIIFVSIVSAPEGINEIKKHHPEVRIVCAAYDEKLNQNKFIIPGLGDFGDRYFGTL